MLSLGDQFTVATAEVQCTILLAAGQAMLATYQGTAFDIGYVALALLIIPVPTLLQYT